MMKQTMEQNKEWIDATWEKTERKLRRVAVRSRDKLPYTTVDGVHDDRSVTYPGWWTNGFWGGMMWLMYLGTGNEEYKTTARRCEELLDSALMQYKKLDHDVGFMWHLTSGANYRITGDEKACNKNLYVAAALSARYNIDGQYIRAWNKWDESLVREGRTCIDTLMNLALLYWAADEMEEESFRRVAMRHMDMAMRDHIRPDGSVNHLVEHELDRVGVREVLGGQGYSADSCWSRGLAWAVYGSMISYIHTGKAEYLEVAKKTADYFIDHCKETDYLPVIDFGAPKEPVYYDSTAGVCAACGMLEIARAVPGEEGERYAAEAVRILKACDQHFCDYSEEQDALVLMGSERYPFDEGDLCKVHIPIIYGDFFFVEALFKLKGNDFLIW